MVAGHRCTKLLCGSPGPRMGSISQFREDPPILHILSLVCLSSVLHITVVILYVTVWLLEISLSLSFLCSKKTHEENVETIYFHMLCTWPNSQLEISKC